MKMTNEKSKTYLSIAGLFVCTLLLGTHYVITKQLTQSMDAVVLTGYRFLVAAIPLFLYLFFARKNPLAKVKPGIILGFFLWLVFILIAEGLYFTSASNTGFISGAFIVFVPIFGYLFFRSVPRMYHLLVIGPSLLGLYFLTGQMQNLNVGDIMILFSAVFTAVHLVLVSHYAKENIDPTVLCFQQFVVVFVLSFFFAFVTGKDISFPVTQTIPLLFLGLFATLSVFFLQMVSLRRVSEVTAAIILALQPVFAAIFAIFFGGETIVLIQMIGGSLIFGATIVNQIFSFSLARRENRLP